MTHQHKILCIIFIGTGLAGIIFGLFHYEYLLWQTRPSKPHNISIHPLPYQKVPIFYSKNDTWIKEMISINISELQESCFSLIKEWLTTLQNEHIISHYVSLDSTLIDANKKNIYISLDKSLFYAHQSTHQKLLLLASLSKTLASLKSPLQKYILLVNNAPLIDPLIDCQEPFDINYFATLY